MDSEEEEPLHVPNVGSSLISEDNRPVSTATASGSHHENTESQQCQLESASEWDEWGLPKEVDGQGVADAEVASEAEVADEEGSEGLIVGEEKHEMLYAGGELKVSSPVDGNKGAEGEGEGVRDREESLVADEEKPDMEDMAVDGVIEEMEKADVSDEKRGIVEGREVSVAEQPDAELAKEVGNFEGQKVVDDVQDQIEMPEENELADVAEERGIAEVDDVTEQTVVMEEKGMNGVMENTGIMEEREVVDVAMKGEMMVKKQVDSELEQTGILEEIRVGYMTEKTELLDEKPVVDVAERTGIAEETCVTDMVEKRELPEDKMEVNFGDQRGILEETRVIDMVEKSEILEEKSVANVSEPSENLDDTDVVRVTGMDMAEVGRDRVMGEELETAEDTETGNVAGDVGKAEATEEAVEDAEMLDMTEEIETDVPEETEDTEEVEDASKASGGKQKPGKNRKSKVLARAPSRKKVEEDICFICFDGGELVLCDRRGCPKAYHAACIGRDEAFFRAKGKWNCGWHICSNCKKNAYYLCYTCTFSLCKGCIKDSVILCIRGNKGLCESCMSLVMLIERNEQAQVDFDDRSSWEYLFKDYWIDLKRKLSITSDELAQAKNPRKVSENRTAKQESPNELYGFNDGGGSSSDSSSGNAEVTVSKRRKTRSQSWSRSRDSDSRSTLTASGEGASADPNAEWASKELLEVVSHMRNGDKSVLSRMELSQLILDYIQKHKLRDRRNKSYVICDSRLKNLFGKPRVGHIEMLNLLDPHIFFAKEDSQTDDLQGSVFHAESNQLEADWNSDALTKTGKDKKRKTHKKSDTRGLQSNLDDYAAIDTHNINLIYLRRNLVEDLIEDSETFHDKVVGSFVRIRISGAGQKQDLYRLVQVVGASKVAEPYRVGKRTTDFLLQVLNLNKTEAISIDIISNQEFTEDECKRLRQSIKCGLINRLTVGDIQEKAMAIQVVRVKDWLESEIIRLSHLRDRASEKGHRKELRECVEKLQILKTPEERLRRLEEIPEIHVDPNMDPSYESEEDEGKDDKRQDNYMRPRGSGFSRRGKEPNSPWKGGFSSSDSWSGTRNYSSMSRELSRSLSNKGFTSKGDDSVGASEMENENLWNLRREIETQQPNCWERPKAASSSEIGTRNTHSIVIQEPSLKVVSEISPAPLSAGAATVVQINETEKIWHYQDPSGKVQGPFSMVQLQKWSNTGYFPAELKIWRTNEKQDNSLLLTDVLAGKFQKDPPVIDNSLPMAQMALYRNSVGATLKQGMQSQVGERSKFNQNQVAWSPQRTLSSSGHSAGKSWKSQTEVDSSTVGPAPSSLEIPKYSRDPWGLDTNLPSPTPKQSLTGGTRSEAFESKWSPTPVQSSGSPSVANPVQGGATGLQTPTVVSESGSPAAAIVHSCTMVSGESHRTQVNAQASINLGADMKNVGVSLQNMVQSVSSLSPFETHGLGSWSVSRHEAVAASSIPLTGTQAWGSASAQRVEPNPLLAMPAQPAAYGHWNDSSQSCQNAAPFRTGNPAGVFPSPGQPTLLLSDSWRPTAPLQSNVQLPAPSNLPWGMTVADNQDAALRRAPGNENTGWGAMPGNQNMGWGAPGPASTNVNWGSSSQGSTSVNQSPSWAAPGQAPVPVNANSGWTAPGNAMQGWVPPRQGPAVINASSGCVAQGQGAATGSVNPSYVLPSGNSGMCGCEQNHNGDKFLNQGDRGCHSQGGDSVFGGPKSWNRQSSFSSGGGSSGSPFKGHRVCKFHESGHCKKGASCDYMHT